MATGKRNNNIVYGGINGGVVAIMCSVHLEQGLGARRCALSLVAQTSNNTAVSPRPSMYIRP